MRFVALSGSVRAQSTNTSLLNTMAQLGLKQVQIDVYQDLVHHPIFNPDLPNGTPKLIQEFIENITTSDGLIIASPEYAHGIPGGLKNALDWLVSDPYIPHKPVMLVHASPRSTISRAHLTEVLTTMSLLIDPGPQFTINLLKMSPHEIRALLDQDIEKNRLLSHLNTYIQFVERTGQQTTSRQF